MTDDSEAHHSGIGIFGVIILVLVGWFIWHNWIRTDYSKPWWTGVSNVRLCKVPYYSNSECYILPVTSDGERITRVDFKNGGYFDRIGSQACHKAGDKSIGRFCEFYESGNRWDVLP